MGRTLADYLFKFSSSAEWIRVRCHALSAFTACTLHAATEAALSNSQIPSTTQRSFTTGPLHPSDLTSSRSLFHPHSSYPDFLLSVKHAPTSGPGDLQFLHPECFPPGHSLPLSLFNSRNILSPLTYSLSSRGLHTMSRIMQASPARMAAPRERGLSWPWSLLFPSTEREGVNE